MKKESIFKAQLSFVDLILGGNFSYLALCVDLLFLANLFCSHGNICMKSKFFASIAIELKNSAANPWSVGQSAMAVFNLVSEMSDAMVMLGNSDPYIVQLLERNWHMAEVFGRKSSWVKKCPARNNVMSNQTSCFELPKIFGVVFQGDVAVFKLPTSWQCRSFEILKVKR